MPFARSLSLVLGLILVGPAFADDPPAQSDPHDAGDLVNRGFTREKAGDLDGAIAAYDAAIKVRPLYAKAFLRRGWAYRQKGAFDRAIVDLSASIELNPWDALAFSNRGYVWADKNDFTSSAADFEEAIRLDPKEAYNYLQCGFALRYLGKTDRAGEVLTQYVAMRPTDHEGYYQRGYVRLVAGENHRSTFDFDEAVRLKPDYAPAYVERSVARRRMKEFEQAVADASHAIRLEPNKHEGYYARGETYRVMPNPAAAKAVQDYDDVVRLVPTHHAALHMRAWVRATALDESVRDGEKAAADARKACDLTNWTNPDYLDTLAAAEAECGRFAEAIRYEKQALQNETYAKSKSGESARYRLKMYEEGKAYREGAPAEVPAIARPPERRAGEELVVPAIVSAGLLAGVGMVAFRLRQLGAYPFRRRPTPPEAIEGVEPPADAAGEPNADEAPPPKPSAGATE